MLKTFLNELELIFCTQLNGLKHFYLTPIILLTIYHLKAFSFLNRFELICMYISVAIVSTQINIFIYFYLTVIILFNINPLFADSEVVTGIAI